MFKILKMLKIKQSARIKKKLSFKNDRYGCTFALMIFPVLFFCRTVIFKTHTLSSAPFLVCVDFPM